MLTNASPGAWRVAMATLCGSLILWMSLYIGLPGVEHYVGWRQERTVSLLERADETISQFQHAKGRLPKTLAECELRPFDGWRRPYFYSTHGNTYQIVSYGQDGKPGGRGYDADLSNRQPFPSAARISWLEVMAFPEAGGIITVSILSALLTACLAFRATETRDGEKMMPSPLSSKSPRS